MPNRPMLAGLSLFVLAFAFLVCAAGVWLAGIHLSKASEALSKRWGLGEALGGMILLAIVTNLPEVAIVATGAWHGDLGVAVGNILGGIALQTVVLVLLDVIGLNRKAPLTRRAASPAVTLAGVLVLAMLAISLMGTQLPDTLIFAHVTPAGALIVLLWIGGLWVIRKAANMARPEPGAGQSSKKDGRKNEKESPARALAVFAICAAVTLLCGVVLEISSEAIAKQLGMSGVLFGATFLAAATALPEVSTGLAAIKLRDYEMAVSDILGGNAFLPVLFPVASLFSGQAVLPDAQKNDIYLTGLGMLLTTVYLAGLVLRPSFQIARMGIDSFVVLLLYIAGVAGLWLM